MHVDSSVRDRRPLIRVHISSTMLFTWNFQPAMETATLIIFSVFQYPFLVMLKDGEPVIVEWFPAKSTTISVVFFWFGFILPLNHVLLIPISPSSDRLPDCPEGPAVSRYGFFQRMDGLSTQMRRMDSLNTTEPGKTWWCSALWISSSGSIFTFHVTLFGGEQRHHIP